MFKAFFASKKWALWAYGGGICLLLSLYAQVHMSVLINTWYGNFYNVLQEVTKHTTHEFFELIRQVFYIAIPYVLLTTLTNYFTRLYAFRWRQAITFEYIPRWRQVNEDIEGSSQRLQEDTYRFAKIVESLGLQITKALMTLVAFLPILWVLSNNVSIPILNNTVGSLVWVAIVTSVGGMAISWFVGIKLPSLEYNNQKVEAAFRKELVYAEDDKHNFALLPTLTELFTNIRFNYHRLFLHYGYFDIWANLYDQLMMIVPYIIAGPSLFRGAILLGVLVQIANAFSQVHGSFSVFITNWTTITELRSIWRRLHEFERNIDLAMQKQRWYK